MERRYLMTSDCFWSCRLVKDIDGERVLDRLCRFLLRAKDSDPTRREERLEGLLKSFDFPDFGGRDITSQILRRQIDMLDKPSARLCPTCKSPWPPTVRPKDTVHVYRGTDTDGDPGVWALSDLDIREGWKPRVFFALSASPDHSAKEGFWNLPSFFCEVSVYDGDDDNDGDSMLIAGNPVMSSSLYPAIAS